MKAAIIGASGGIGSALTHELAASGVYSSISALSRSGQAPGGMAVKSAVIDILHEESIAAASEGVGAVDLVIVASGMLSPPGSTGPEKSYRHQKADAFEQVFAVNTIGPALVAKHFLPKMPRKGRTVFAALSARVGSISDNRIGGWHAYRASKAALNMLVRNFAIEQSRRNPDSIVVSLHPGTVDTGLSKPFQANVPDAQLFTPTQSATMLINVINGLTPADTGGFFDWAGKPIDF